MRKLDHIAVPVLLLGLRAAAPALAQDPGHDFGVGAFGGVFYDSDPLKLVGFQRTNFKKQFNVEFSVTRKLYQLTSLPLSFELEGDISRQFGQASLGEVGIVPVARWDGFPWNDFVKTSFVSAGWRLLYDEGQSLRVDRERR